MLPVPSWARGVAGGGALHRLSSCNAVNHGNGHHAVISSYPVETEDTARKTKALDSNKQEASIDMVGRGHCGYHVFCSLLIRVSYVCRPTLSIMLLPEVLVALNMWESES